MRDRVVLWVLGCGALAALAAWHVIGPWPAIVLVALAVMGAALVYRIEPPTIDLDGTPWLDEAHDLESSRAKDQ